MVFDNVNQLTKKHQKMRRISTLLLLFITVYGISQTNYDVEKQQFTINALLPGLVYEVGVSKNATIAAEATVGFAYFESNFFGDAFGIYPIGRLQYRNYYNFERRLEKGKNISGNSGNYIAPTFALQSGKAIIGDLDYISDFFAGAGVVYGIQRTAPRGFQFRLEAGPAYFFEENQGDFGILLAAKIGWVLRKRRK